MTYQDRDPRVDLRTVAKAVEVFDVDALGPPFRVWTMDLSTSGVKVVSLQQIKSPRILLQFTAPEFEGDTYVCDVIHQSIKREKLGKGLRTQYTYGLSFTARVESGRYLPVFENDREDSPESAASQTVDTQV